MKYLNKIINFPRYKLISGSLAATLFCLFWISEMSLVRGSSLFPNQEIEAVEALIQVGKYRLNFQVIKGRGLNILLEAGGGMDSREWNKLAPEIARKTGATIVSYDRAGFGESDLPETPHDMGEEVEWLWEGLQKLKLDKNLILVGHSFGGWMIRLFANEHPEAVCGMVFVDPFTNEFVELLGVEYLDNHPLAGKIPFDTSQPDKLSKYQRALVRMVGDGLGPKMEVMQKTSVPSEIPVVVITNGKPFLPKTEEQEAWRLSHEQLTASIKGATLIVAGESDHMIPARQPDLVIEAVLDVIERNSPILKGPYLGQKPYGFSGIEEDYWPTQGWRVSTPEEQGVDSRTLAEAVNCVREKNLNIHSILVIRNGYIVTDVTFDPFTPDTKHDVASVTKSITSTLIGIAIGKGLIEKIDTPVLDYFPDWDVKNLDAKKRQMTVENLLTMTAGLECIAQPTEVTLMQMMGSPDWIQFMLDLPMEFKPGKEFVYNSGGVHLLSAIVRKATGKSSLEFAEANLFKHLGISDVSWPMDPQGISNTGWGSVRMKPHDMAKLGYLYLKNGIWDGEQIISSSWVSEATQTKVKLRGGDGYGYLWWIFEDNSYSALGRGGQCVYVLPEKNLIIVMTGGGLPMSTIQFPDNYILPAVHNKQSLPPDQEGVSQLKDASRRAAQRKKMKPEDVPPIPEIAQKISGKKFTVESNPLGVLDFRLTFIDEREAKIQLDLALDSDRAPEYLLGLDGVSRISQGRFGIPASGTAAWESYDTFKIHINEIGNINRFDIVIVFDEKTAELSLFEKTGLGKFTARARLRD